VPKPCGITKAYNTVEQRPRLTTARLRSDVKLRSRVGWPLGAEAGGGGRGRGRCAESVCKTHKGNHAPNKNSSRRPCPSAAATVSNAAAAAAAATAAAGRPQPRQKEQQQEQEQQRNDRSGRQCAREEERSFFETQRAHREKNKLRERKKVEEKRKEKHKLFLCVFILSFLARDTPRSHTHTHSHNIHT